MNDEMITITEHQITITFPVNLTWDDIRKDLKHRVDHHHNQWEQEDSAKRRAQITANQAARKID